MASVFTAICLSVWRQLLLPVGNSNCANFAIAFMLEPLTDRLERNGHSRTQAVLLSLIVAALGMLLILLFLLPSVIRQLGQSFERFPLALSAIAEQSRRIVL
jgi:predicted PurR-regulated permease PerM